MNSSAVTASPTASPASCFAGTETVFLESGDLVAIADIQVGDRVLASNEAMKFRFANVVSVPYKRNNVPAEFLVISTVKGKELKLTAEHLLPAGACGGTKTLMMAGEIKKGDCVVTIDSKEEVVEAIGSHKGRGIYTIITDEDFIIVGGIVASPFAINHHAANSFYAIHRLLGATWPWLLHADVLQSINTLFAIFVSDTVI